eukprot:scaffold2785_cov165-Ochromonas_danica.AAC.11
MLSTFAFRCSHLSKRTAAVGTLLASSRMSTSSSSPPSGSKRAPPRGHAQRRSGKPSSSPSKPSRGVTITPIEWQGGTPVVQLEPGRSLLFKRDGNPLVYAHNIGLVHGQPQSGEEVIVADHHGNIFGRGFYNEFSQYRVRMMTLRDESTWPLSMEEVLSHHIQSAISRRRAISLPSVHTNAYRLVNGEGDRLSGLMVDVLANRVVVQSGALWVEKQAPAIKAALIRLLKIDEDQLVWKQQASRLQRDGAAAFVQDETSSSTNGEDLHILENDLRYILRAENEQKTGFYCDQRSNRLMVRRLAQDRSVLDAYCYTGGFTMNALLGGAKEVTAIDSSKAAIETAGMNCELNGLLGENEEGNSKATFLQGDAVEVMRDLIDEGRTFDFVILDPPKLAPSRDVLEKALRKYSRINQLGMKLVPAEGGLLLTCSCSAAVTQDQQCFINMLQKAAQEAGRQMTILSITSAAEDHVVSPSYLEGRYLTAALLHIV